MKLFKNRKIFILVVSLLISAVYLIPILVHRAYASTLTSGSAQLSDSRPSSTAVTYTVQFSNVTQSATRCLKMEFSNTAVGHTIPSNMSTTGAGIENTGTYVPTPSSWTHNHPSNGIVTWTYAAGETPASSSGRTVVLSSVTNGDTANTQYYLQFSTYSNQDCSTDPIDSATISFIYTNGQAVSVTVDPTISFTVNTVGVGQSVNGQPTTVATTSTTIPFGTITASTNGVGAHDLTVTTNAGSGYTIYTRFTGSLTYNGNIIADHTGINGSPSTFPVPGNAAFGYTTADSTLNPSGTVDRFTSGGGNKWAGFTQSNAELVYNGAAVSSQTTRVGYQVGIAGTTPAGTYTTTVTLVATPTY